MRFKERYRVPSARLPAWDYRWAGVYGVTLCTQVRQPWFGTVVGDSVDLSRLGQIVAREWQRIPVARPFITLDEWIVMPDHLHGILIFGEIPDAEGSRDPSRLLANSLGAVMGQFKSKCTKEIWGKGHRGFAWQERFFDQIVWNEKMLHRLRLYIRQNPLRWTLKRGAGIESAQP
jgi:REP element-mobilizing transposase RayT